MKKTIIAFLTVFALMVTVAASGGVSAKTVISQTNCGKKVCVIKKSNCSSCTKKNKIDCSSCTQKNKSNCNTKKCKKKKVKKVEEEITKNNTAQPKKKTKDNSVQPKETTAQPNETTAKLSADENSYVQQIVDLVNQERRKEGLSSVTLDSTLTNAAMTRAKEIEISFAHTRPNGTSFSTVLAEYQISYRAAGENIAWGQSSPQEVMNGWMNSSGHRANILNANYKKIGVGYYKNASGRKFWSQLFIN